jgi:aminoglycoside phosphotransferase (APT) family kinase protein
MIATIPDFRDAKDTLQVKKFSHGQSNPTYLLTLNSMKVVMRKKPPGKLLRAAHAVDREYQIQHALWRQNFPVPRPIHYCQDVSIIGTEFYIMEYV